MKWNWLKSIFTRSVICPRCLGKGDVDENDIQRLNRQNMWTTGTCAYCMGVGKVPKKQPSLIEPNNVYLTSCLSEETRNKLLNGDEVLLREAKIKNELAEKMQAYFKNMSENKSSSQISSDTKENDIEEEEISQVPMLGNFAVHKKGFFYTDEAFEELKGEKGSIIGFYPTKEDAKRAIEEADIKTMLSMAGSNAVDFFFYSEEYDDVYAEFEIYLKDKFNIEIEDKYCFSFPEQMDKSDAIKFLELLKLSFHFVLEYESIDTIDPNGFRQKLWDLDSDEF